MEADPDRIAADGQLTMSDAAWEQAKSRAAVIGALATRRVTGIAAADEAAMKLGISRRHVYLLLGRQRPTPPRHPIHTNPTRTGCAGRRRAGKGRRSTL